MFVHMLTMECDASHTVYNIVTFFRAPYKYSYLLTTEQTISGT